MGYGRKAPLLRALCQHLQALQSGRVVHGCSVHTPFFAAPQGRCESRRGSGWSQKPFWGVGGQQGHHVNHLHLPFPHPMATAWHPCLPATMSLVKGKAGRPTEPVF